MFEKPYEPKIVVIGGGTGLSVLLRGLKKYTSNLTAIVTVSDDGGSSGRLGVELGVLPPGDIRNCLVALAETESIMETLFQHRFFEGSSLKGHNLGNLLLAALTEITGDMVTAIKEVSRVLKVRGQVIPATLEHVSLGAHMRDGAIVRGETAIRNYGAKIEKIFLLPKHCQPAPDSIQAIMEADGIVMGPGSLYTSIIPNLLVDGVTEAIMKSPAPSIYVCNIMTEKGETDDYSALDHLISLSRHVHEQIIDYMIVNSGEIDQERLGRYWGEDAVPVAYDTQELNKMGVQVIGRDLLSASEWAWHDSNKLGLLILEMIARHKMILNAGLI